MGAYGAYSLMVNFSCISSWKPNDLEFLTKVMSLTLGVIWLQPTRTSPSRVMQISSYLPAEYAYSIISMGNSGS